MDKWTLVLGSAGFWGDWGVFGGLENSPLEEQP